MNSRCSRELAAESSADVYLIGEPSPQWSSTLTPRPSSSPDKTTAHSRLSLFGTMSALLTVARGAVVLTSFPEVSPAKTYRQPGKAQESTERGPGYGLTSRESFARFDRTTRSWKTPQCLFPGVLDEFSGTWPKSGMMLRGQCWELTTSELRTSESEYGFSRRTPDGISFFHTPCTGGLDGGSNSRKALSKIFLTPMASEGLRSTFSPEVLAEHWRVKPKSNLSEQIAFETVFPTPRTKGLCGGSGSFASLNRLLDSGSITETERRAMASGNGGHLNPEWVEWLMGWTIGWTDLGASATGKCRFARRQPSESYTNS